MFTLHFIYGRKMSKMQRIYHEELKKPGLSSEELIKIFEKHMDTMGELKNKYLKIKL